MMAFLEYILFFSIIFLNLKVNSQKYDPEFIFKILGGIQAEKGEFPFMASLQEDNTHFCGGTIYNSRYILTAAHCFPPGRLTEERFSNLYAVVGMHDLQDQKAAKHKFHKVILHNYFNFSTMANDIALVRLETSIQFNSFAYPTTLDTDYINTDIEVTTIGWGASSAKERTSQFIKYINFITTDISDCQSTFTTPITDSQICVETEEGKGSCHGDSGGALIANGKQIGITSFGAICRDGDPEVYTRISSYYDWIVQTCVLQDILSFIGAIGIAIGL